MLIQVGFKCCKKIYSNVKTELGTQEWDTINPECLIRISNVDTFDFLLSPLFFGYSTEKSEIGFSKLESASRFCI